MKTTTADLKRIVKGTLGVALMLLTVPLALGQSGDMRHGDGMLHGEGMQQMQGRGDAVRGARGEGEILSLDRAAGKVKLRHGPMPDLDWPPMTMRFHVQDPSMLEGLQEGQTVRFEVHMRPDGSPTITHIE